MKPMRDRGSYGPDDEAERLAALAAAERKRRRETRRAVRAEKRARKLAARKERKS